MYVCMSASMFLLSDKHIFQHTRVSTSTTRGMEGAGQLRAHYWADAAATIPKHAVIFFFHS